MLRRSGGASDRGKGCLPIYHKCVHISPCILNASSQLACCKLVTWENCDESQSFCNQLVWNGDVILASYLRKCVAHAVFAWEPRLEISDCCYFPVVGREHQRMRCQVLHLARSCLTMQRKKLRVLHNCCKTKGHADRILFSLITKRPKFGDLEKKNCV